MRTLVTRWLPWLLILPLASPCLAEVYFYKDAKGVTHITNVRKGSNYKRVIKTPTYSKPAARNVTYNSASGNGWKIFKPGATGSYRASLGGSKRNRGKPFSVNESNRALYDPHIQSIARQHRLDPALIHAVISAESAFNPMAVSHAGAMGLMQLMPATAERFGVSNAFDPIANIRGGAEYLSWLLNKFKNIDLAIAAYNAGEGAVMKYNNSIPPYKETQTYVSRVRSFYDHYRKFN